MQRAARDPDAFEHARVEFERSRVGGHPAQKLKFQDFPNIKATRPDPRLLTIRRSEKLNDDMPTIAETIANSRAFNSAVATADKFGADDIPFLRYYFLQKQGTSTFLFQWLDKLERGGLTREQVLSVVHGADYQHEDHVEVKKPSSPKKRKYTRRAKTPTDDDDETPAATPATSPTRPSKKRVVDEEDEPEPVTPKAPSKKKTAAAPPPPAKKPRTSKKETQVIDESDLDEEDEEEESESSSSDEGDDEFEVLKKKVAERR